MYNVSIQVSTPKKYWEETPKKFQSFETWEDLVTFGYRLSLFFNTEIRIENKGNGHYFNVEGALNYLDS